MARERLVSGEDRGDDKEFNWGLRPRSLDEYIGQRESVERLQIAIEAAKARGEVLDHLLLHGPPGLGKCITKDSLILTDGGIVPFAELLPPDMQPGESRPTATRVYGVQGLESASHVYCSGVTPTRRLRTRAGFVLEGTAHHPVLVASSQGARWKTLGELTSQDFVAVSRGANVWGQSQSAIYRPDTSQQRRARSESLVRQLHEEFSQSLQRPPSVVELREAYCAVRGISSTPTPSRTVQRLGLAVSDGRILRESRPVMPFLPEREVGHTVSLDAEAGYLLGTVVGDGHVEKGASSPTFVITCADEAMQRELQRVSRHVYGVAPQVKQYGDKAARLHFSPQQGRVLQAFGLRPVNAREKSVPAAVLQGTRVAVVGFLQGLFDADGHSRADGVEFYTRSEQLARETQLLLANFGIIAYRRSRPINEEPFWSLFIGGADAVTFHQQIGFRLERKRQAFTPVSSQNAGWRRSDLVPGANALLCALLRQSGPHSRATHRAFEHAKNDDRTPSRRQVAHLLELLPHVSGAPEYTQLQALCDERFSWDQVVSLEVGEAETYDFMVPGTHSFVANGIVNHNTTLAYIIAEEMGREIAMTSGPALERPADVMGFLVNAKEGDIIFIDEIHRLPRIVEEFLYSAMEDWIVNFTLDKGMYSKPLPIRLEKFTIVGATTRPAMLTRPLRDRFGLQQHLDFYDEADLITIAERSAHLLKSPMQGDGAREISRRSRGTPRITNRLLRRVRDYALVRADGVITSDVAHDALRLEGIDDMGLDRLDHAVLRVIKDTYGGGPVGIEALAATLNEETDTLVDVVEPYLLKIGFLARTPAGRRITRRGYEHLGEIPPPNAIGPLPTLFDEALEAEPRLRRKSKDKLPPDGKADDKEG